MSLDVRDILLALLGVVSAVYLYGRWGMSFFTRRGVRSMPASPFVGHMGYVVKKTEHLRDTIQRLYKTHPDEKYVGLYDFSRPTLLVKDPELIKKMTIKDFDHFQDHTQRVSPEANPLLATSLFFLQGQRWRDMRPRLSPAFTSSKMKHMLEFITECTEKLSEFYLKEVKRPENADKGVVELELKDVLTRYTNDVIGTCAFGLKVNSLDDRDNEFYTMGRDLTTFGGVTMVIKMLFFNMFPALMQWLKISMLRVEITKFFTDLVLGTMRRREQEKIIRPDMIHLLMEAKKGDLVYKETEATKDVGFSTVDESAIGKVAHKKTHWTDVELVSQAAIFFIAGFETSSTLLCFMCHEVATRPEIQRRLQEEVDEVAATNEGKVTYADLQNMKYLDMVVSETLRFWPPVPKLDRMCVKSYKLPPSSPGAKPYTVLPKESLWFPVYAIHHDPKYYEDPETFDPERFSDENKSKIDASTYMPFGIGPRNCIGSRFALMEAKALIFQLLLKFDLVRTSKTQVPMRIKTNQHFITAENGFWVGLKPRNKSK